ncbi:MAG: response regulator, partial [Calditrichales bacterium]
RVVPGENDFIKTAVDESDEIVLPWEKDIFTIKFAALDYNIPEKNNYAYMLVGVDRDWVYTDASRRMATYTKLQPGAYTFRVKGSNNDGVWNETGRSLEITILPPWWRTNLAYSIYIIFGLGLLTLIWRMQIHRLGVLHKLELEHLTAEKFKEVDHLKSRFFTNISHEFRTPLTLIQGPVQQLLSGRFSGNFKEQYRLILNYTNRLLTLVNQLLDLSKLEAGQLTLKACPVNIVPLLQGLVYSFRSLAEQRRISLSCECTRKVLKVYLDKPQFEQIINNLMSNALKFTPEGGNIVVKLEISAGSKTDDFFRIIVWNTGPGIASDQLGKVFDRFYQAENGKSKSYEGAGIGLALVKELVELHHGRISVHSIPGKETTFMIELLLGRKHLTDEQIVPGHAPETRKDVFPATAAVHDRISFKGRKHTRLLITEDHTDMRTYIANIFRNGYEIFHAGNGLEGLEIARSKQPDLIISDVMMPEMDGIELCRRLKSDQITSHIPVILITARAGQEDKLEGLEIGADDYITKPFDADELFLRVQNLIEQRRRLHQKFISQPGIHPREITVTSIDEKFLQKLFTTIENNISDPDLDMKVLEESMHLSRSSLYRKITVLTGMNPSALIRHIRLQRARKLLEANGGNITEVAISVGFNNVGYFSTCFTQLFGINPSSFVRSLS